MKLLDYRPVSGGHVVVSGHRERFGWHLVVTVTPPGDGPPATVEVTATETAGMHAGILLALGKLMGGRP